MFTIGNITTIGLSVIAIGLLGWSYYRNRDLGKFGTLSWMQSVALMAPWLLSFGAASFGFYINLAGTLLLLVASTILYIWLGNQARLAAQDPEVAVKILDRMTKTQTKRLSKTGEIDPQALPMMLEMSNIPDADLSSVKSIFGIDTFYATETIPYQQGAIFKGNLRGEAQAVRHRLTTKLEDKLGDKYRLFLIPDPEGRPVVVVLPSTNDPQPATVGQKVLAGVMLVATIATSLETMGVFLGFDFYAHVDRYKEILPLTLGIWTILIAHEMGHQVLAELRGVKVSLPFFLPTGQIGSFGAITKFESLVPDRSVLFDVSIAGPITGGLVSFAMLIIGLFLSHPNTGVEIPSQFFQGSILVGTVARIALGDEINDPSVWINPLVVVGWLGLVINALNLMPVGQLDGGRIIQAIYGRKTAQRATLITLVLLGTIAFFNPANLVILYWLILVGFLQRALERPTLDEITEPNDARAALGLVALFLMVMTVIPIGSILAEKLGIG